MSASPSPASGPSVADALAALVAAEGTGAHGYPAGLTVAQGAGVTRNMADALHHVCNLHGWQPNVLEHAANRHAASPAGRFLNEAAHAFGRERAFLARLSVSAGPMPSTPGSANSESAALGQRHALAMLASSDRSGTAFGAAAALLIDWRDVRRLLERAADRLGVDAPACRLPGADDTLAVAGMLATSAGAERAIVFGAQQYLLQQRGLWSLLEAREVARREV